MRIEQLTLNNEHAPSTANIEKAAKEFESFFVYYLLKVMRESVPKSGLFNSGVREDVYNSIMDEKVAEGIASHGGLGLSQLLIKQMMENSGAGDAG